MLHNPRIGHPPTHPHTHTHNRTHTLYQFVHSDAMIATIHSTDWIVHHHHHHHRVCVIADKVSTRMRIPDHMYEGCLGSSMLCQMSTTILLSRSRVIINGEGWILDIFPWIHKTLFFSACCIRVFPFSFPEIRIILVGSFLERFR